MKRFLLVATGIAVVTVALVINGIEKLTPFAQVEAMVPAKNLLTIANQKVYVEQSGKGQPLLLLHGFAASSYSFREIVPLLARDFRVIALDLNGFGYTERPEDPKAFLPVGQLDLITGVMDQLGVTSASVVGQSYGALLALILAETRPERVQNLILISPAVGSAGDAPPAWARSRLGREVSYCLIRGLLTRPRRFQEFFSNAYHRQEVFSLKESEEYRQRLLVEGLGRTYRAFHTVLASGEQPTLDLTKIHQPALVIAGRHDQIVPLQQCRDVAQKLGKADLLVLEQSGHSAPEEEPAALAQNIRQLLSKP